MMLSKFAIIVCVLSTFSCSFETVEPATMGKILTPQGYEADLLVPGKYITWWRDQMVIVETGTNIFTEAVLIKLSDKLSLTADVRFRARISSNKGVINSMFNDIRADDDYQVTFPMVYAVYGSMAVRNVAREVIGQYNVDEVQANYNRISVELGTALAERLEGTPIEISDVALGNIEYPSVVVAAINAAEERRLFLDKEQAQAEIDQLKAEIARILAEANYQVEMTVARTIRDKNSTIAEGLTSEILELRRIEALELMATNQRAVFMPFEALSTTGASMAMFNRPIAGNN